MQKEEDDTKQVYIPPLVFSLEDTEIETGGAQVPEGTSGQMS